jgi:hypothetical protein
MKTFTLEQANALVPLVADLLDHLAKSRDELVAARDALEPVLHKAGGNGGSKAGGDYALLLQHFNALLDTFKEWGCELKDLDDGLVDFPSHRDGRLVYLCWKRGETRIEYWHDLDSGFAGRQPL